MYFHAELFTNVLEFYILPNPESFLIGEAQSPGPDLRLRLGVRYGTPRHCLKLKKCCFRFDLIMVTIFDAKLTFAFL